MNDETRPPDPLTDDPTAATMIASTAVPSSARRGRLWTRRRPAADALPGCTRHPRPRGARDQGQRAPAGQHGRGPDRARGGGAGATRCRPGAAGHHRRRPPERGAAAHQRARRAHDRDPATGCPRPALPAGARPRGVRPGAHGRPRVVGGQAGAQAGTRQQHRGNGPARRDGPPDLDADTRGAAGAGRPGRGAGPRRWRRATTRSTTCTTASSPRCWS